MKSATVITGGGRGIGKAISLKMAQHSPVLIVGRTESNLRETCRAMTDAGGMADYVVGDVAQPSTAQRTMQRLQENSWKVQNVICNAGIGKSSPTHELSFDQWSQILATNLNGSFNFAQAALPSLMAQRSGTICFIASLAGVKAYPYEAAYTASKHAVVGLAKSLALEYGKHGISVVPICPGFVEGDMTERTINGVAARKRISNSEAREIVARTNPQRRIIHENEIARTVEFVCAGEAPSLSGNPLILSGGAI